MFIVYIDPRKSELPERIGFETEAELIEFVNKYIFTYYPKFKNNGKNNDQRRENIFAALCTIQKRNDDGFKILEIENKNSTA